MLFFFHFTCIAVADTRSQVVHIGFDFIIENGVLIMLQELGTTNHIIISMIQNQILLVLLQIVILQNRLPPPFHVEKWILIRQLGLVHASLLPGSPGDNNGAREAVHGQMHISPLWRQ